MARARRDGTMPCMSTPTVTESPLRLEAVTSDPFVADLESPVTESQRQLLAAAASRRRIYD
jgi:hypothetical protein